MNRTTWSESLILSCCLDGDRATPFLFLLAPSDPVPVCLCFLFGGLSICFIFQDVNALVVLKTSECSGQLLNFQSDFQNA